MSPRTAVVIDDEPDMTKYLSSILEDNGFAVRIANDARSGEDLIRESPPDIILLDLMMPGRAGTTLFVKLRGDDTTKDIPLVMVSGIREELNIDWSDMTKKFKARKPDAFIEKPVEPDTLMSVINDVLSGRKIN